MTTDSNTLLFDLGGVIFDISFEKTFAAWQKLSQLELATLRNRFVVNSDYLSYERGDLDALTFFTLLADKLEIEASYEQMQEAWNAIFVGINEQTVELLADLPDHLQLYAFSNTNSVHRDYMLHHYPETLERFGKVFYSCDIGLRKPDAEAFQFVAQKIGVAPKSILFFDDSSANTQAASALGMQSVLVTSPEDIAKALHQRSWR